MKGRPLCRLCFLILFVLWILFQAGIFSAGGMPFSEKFQETVSRQETCRIAGICGEITETENGCKFLLYNSYYLFHSKNYPIQNVMIYMTEKKGLSQGAFVVLSGNLSEFDAPGNPGEFDLRGYYACRHCYYRLTKAVLMEKKNVGFSVAATLSKLKGRASGTLKDIAGKEAELLGAILLGEKREVDQEILDRFRLAGFLHICSISGLHISILGMGLFSLLKKFCFRNGTAAFFSGVLVLSYGIMTGSSVSTLRALVMFVVWAAAKILGRIYDLLSAMALALLLILLESPVYFFDSGFWLSFSAVVGIGAVTPMLVKMTGIRSKAGRSLMGSLGILLSSLPVTLVVYGEYSVIGFLLNLLIMPTVPVVIYSGTAGILAGSLWKTGGEILVTPGRMLVRLYEKLSFLHGILPGSIWTPGRPETWQVILYILCICGMLFAGRLLEKRSQKRKPGESTLAKKKRRKKFHQFMRGGLFIGSFFCIGILSFRIKTDFEVTCLDVGQGDGIVIQSPDHQNFLIDGGSTSKNQMGTYQILPYLRTQGISHLDAVVVSHTDLDHISGVLEILEMIEAHRTSLEVGMLLLPNWEIRGEAYEQLLEAAENAGVPVGYLCSGESFQGGDLILTVWNPTLGQQTKDANEDSLVVELNWKGYRALFTGDAGEAAEQTMLSNGFLEDVDYLKVGHHGSRYSTSEEFLEAVSPEIAVVSCGKQNLYGHPAQETLKRLKQAGCDVFCTKDLGAVTTHIWQTPRGKRIKVEGFRQN